VNAIHYKDQFNDFYVDIAIQHKKRKGFLIYFGVFKDLFV